MAGSSVATRNALGQLLSICTSDSERRSVDELVRRVSAQSLRVLIAGEAKRGKSTLINALLGRSVLPSGVVPLTAVQTTLVHGQTERVQVHLLDGTVVDEPLASLSRFVTETENPGNVLKVGQVVVTLRSQLLEGGVELVDTPGTGSVHRHNTEQAHAAFDRMDAAIFVLSADPPISDSERELVRNVCERSVMTFFVLNKIDRLDEDELAQAAGFTEQVLMKATGSVVQLWPVSALGALEQAAGADRSRPPGRFGEFAKTFLRYLRSSAAQDLLRSVARRGAHVAQTIADRDATTAAASSLTAEQMASALSTLQTVVDGVEAERRATAVITEASIRELVTETNRNAAEVTRTALPGLTEAVHHALATATADHEAVAIDSAVTHITNVVDEWRANWRAELAERLNAVEVELNARLEQSVNEVREATSALFGIELATYRVDTDLVDRNRFRYQYAPSPGQYDVITATLRRRLPGWLTRPWVRRYVVRRATMLLDQQVGRARSDFQFELEDARRRMHSDLTRSYAEGATAIVDAISAGSELRQSEAAKATAAKRSLRERGETARRLAHQLQSLADSEQTTR